jgi:hypothetical protein
LHMRRRFVRHRCSLPHERPAHHRCGLPHGRAAYRRCSRPHGSHINGSFLPDDNSMDANASAMAWLLWNTSARQRPSTCANNIVKAYSGRNSVCIFSALIACQNRRSNCERVCFQDFIFKRQPPHDFGSHRIMANDTRLPKTRDDACCAARRSRRERSLARSTSLEVTTSQQLVPHDSQ